MVTTGHYYSVTTRRVVGIVLTGSKHYSGLAGLADEFVAVVDGLDLTTRPGGGMADAGDLKSPILRDVRVQIPPGPVHCGVLWNDCPPRVDNARGQVYYSIGMYLIDSKESVDGI